MGKKMGRPRKPTSLKIATGTHRADRHGDPDAEPKGIALTVDSKPPEKLNQFEMRFWKQTLAILVPKGLATDLDAMALVEYCRDLRLSHRIREAINSDGLLIDGVMGVRSHPLLTALNQTRTRIMNFESKFGMTPSDRSGMDLGTGRKSKVQSRRRG